MDLTRGIRFENYIGSFSSSCITIIKLRYEHPFIITIWNEGSADADRGRLAAVHAECVERAPVFRTMTEESDCSHHLWFRPRSWASAAEPPRFRVECWWAASCVRPTWSFPAVWPIWPISSGSFQPEGRWMVRKFEMSSAWKLFLDLVRSPSSFPPFPPPFPPSPLPFLLFVFFLFHKFHSNDRRYFQLFYLYFSDKLIVQKNGRKLVQFRREMTIRRHANIPLNDENSITLVNLKIAINTSIKSEWIRSVQNQSN